MTMAVGRPGSRGHTGVGLKAAWGDIALAASMVLALAVVTIALRPPLPVDETRYLTVAWDMARSGSVLVPHLDGSGYTHKPPLLFWAIRLVWALTGVSETGARAVPFLFLAALLAATHGLGRRLWPDRPGVAGLALPLLVAMGPMTVFATLVMFDVPVALGVVLALTGLYGGATRGRRRDWALMAAGLGLGLLAKGPVAAVFVLPALLAAPAWAPVAADAGGARRPARGWRRFAAGGALASLGGIAMLLAWALPAAMAGGPDFARMLLWGQTAGRVVQAFDHARPWWFYLAVAPAMVLPFLFVWLARGPAMLAALRHPARPDEASRFLLVVVAGAVLVMSLVSAKQIHYLLPMLPPLALLIARFAAPAAAAAAAGPDDARLPAGRRWPRRMTAALRRAWVLPALGVGLAGAAAAVVPRAAGLAAADGIMPGPLLMALALIALAVGAAWRLRGHLRHAAALWVLTVIAITIYGGLGPFAAFDVRPIARVVAGLAASGGVVGFAASGGVVGFAASGGGPVAYIGGDHHGLLDFQGRLPAPVVPLPADTDILAWAAAHPDAVIAGRPDAAGAPGWAPVAQMPYRTRRLAVWRAADAPVRPDDAAPHAPAEPERRGRLGG
ncbi:glycosyltransferase family 39 protein [Tistrella bauzanensis]|uniref:Glycosyltransferase family 39 protein n=1 Tax=Tistrella arctica TaxID=3133430 RepID=A0ABU9YMV5_9PROT